MGRRRRAAGRRGRRRRRPTSRRPAGSHPERAGSGTTSSSFPIAWQIDAEGETPNFNLFHAAALRRRHARVGDRGCGPANYAVTHHITTGLVDPAAGDEARPRGRRGRAEPLVDYVPVEDPDYVPEEADAADEASGDDEEAEERSAEEIEERRRARDGFVSVHPGRGAPGWSRDGQVREVRGDLFRLHHLETCTTRPPASPRWPGRPSAPGSPRDTAGKYRRTLSFARVHLRETSSSLRRRRSPRKSGEPPTEIGRRGQGFEPAAGADSAERSETGPSPASGRSRTTPSCTACFLHMHVRGKGRHLRADLPGRPGRRSCSGCRNYAFDWQFEYDLVEPIRVPAGSTVKAIARYDNSRANRLNPAPHKEVYWSEQSWGRHVPRQREVHARGRGERQLTTWCAEGIREGPRAALRRPFFLPRPAGLRGTGRLPDGGWLRGTAERSGDESRAWSYRDMSYGKTAVLLLTAAAWLPPGSAAGQRLGRDHRRAPRWRSCTPWAASSAARGDAEWWARPVPPSRPSAGPGVFNEDEVDEAARAGSRHPRVSTSWAWPTFLGAEALLRSFRPGGLHDPGPGERHRRAARGAQGSWSRGCC